MRWLGLALVLGIFGARWAMVTMDDTALRDDVLFSELLANRVSGVSAANLADAVQQLAERRGCELVPDTLRVDVHDARPGTLHVQGAALTVQGRGPTMVQDIDIQFDCRRKGTFFVKTVAEFRLRTQVAGDGAANHWPSSDGATQ